MKLQETEIIKIFDHWIGLIDHFINYSKFAIFMF